MNRSSVRGFFVLCAAFAAGFGSRGVVGTAEAKPAAESPYTAMSQLGRVLALIENEYVDPVDRTRLVGGAIAGMVSELDPHSGYMPPKEFKDEQEGLSGKFVGIGVEVEYKDDAIVVLMPLDGSPAQKAGVLAGDHIIAVEGQPVKETDFEKLVRRMRGAAGTHVNITIVHKGHHDAITLDIVRAEVQNASVRGAMMPSGVAYIQIKQFQEKTHVELQREIAKLRATPTPIAGVLLDLRSNPGGLVDQAAAVADEFITSGPIYTMRSRGQIVEQGTAHGGGALANLPVVVLVDDFSASASELVAGALQDTGVAIIVGVRSFGKGSVQTVLDLPGGAGVKLTIGRYYTPNGHAVQADGIHPDVTTEPNQKQDAGAWVFHERDYQNALPGEGVWARDGGVTVTYDVPDGGAPESREIPADPRTANDPVMRIGYETLLAKMAKK